MARRNTQSTSTTIILSSLCVFLLVVVGCGPPRPGNRRESITVAADRQILQSLTCPLPCWEGIVPGQSKSDAFALLLKQKFRIPPDSIDEYQIGSGKAMATAGKAAYIQDGIVQTVCLDAISQIRMSEIIKQLGEPTKIQTDSGFYGQEQSGYDARIYYPQQGLVVRFARIGFPSADFHAAIQPNLVADKICLFPSGSVEGIISIAAQFQGPTALRGIYELPLQDWRGYGDYEILPPLSSP